VPYISFIAMDATQWRHAEWPAAPEKSAFTFLIEMNPRYRCHS